ncbi:MAG: peptide-methionine (S)-S-oxide reductase MsrA [Pseudomonadales bacterium]
MARYKTMPVSMRTIALFVLLSATAALQAENNSESNVADTVSNIESSLSPVTIAAEPGVARAYFAGGCFWCMESDFEKIEGVSEAISGFTGGSLQNPTYDGDHSGHYEAIEVHYDPAIVTYQQLLSVYWRNIDPFDAGGQFCDRGNSYRAAIFTSNSAERALALDSKAAVAAHLSKQEQFSQQKVVTPILDVTQFWPVREYHQDYYKKRTKRYKYYRWRCGRDARLADLWQ